MKGNPVEEAMLALVELLVEGDTDLPRLWSELEKSGEMMRSNHESVRRRLKELFSDKPVIVGSFVAAAVVPDDELLGWMVDYMADDQQPFDSRVSMAVCVAKVLPYYVRDQMQREMQQRMVASAFTQEFQSLLARPGRME